MLRIFRSSLALLALVIAACSEAPFEADLTVVSVEVTPADRTITVGDTMVVIARPWLADGTVFGSAVVTWTSSDASVATLTPKGQLGIARALKPGTVEISASTEGKAGKITLNIVAAPLVVGSVQITPSIGALEVGKDFQLSLLVRAQDGTPIGGRTVAWQTSDPSIITITGAADGAHATIRAQRVGQAVITATVEGKTAQRTITVTQVSPVVYIQVAPDSLLVETGKDFALGAMLYDATGQSVEWSGVLWYSSDNTIVEVKSAAGKRATLTAHKAGTAKITADVNGRTAEAFVRVKDAVDVASVAITGGTFAGHTLWSGQIAQYKAVVYRGGSVQVQDHPVQWSVQNPAIAEMRADGVLHALAPGSTYLVAEAGGKKAMVKLTIYALGSNGMELELRPSEDPLGYPRVAIVVGTTTWTDTNGASYPAEKTIIGGTLNLGRGISGYEQRLEIETVVLIGGTQRQVVARETIIDRGTIMYNALDPLSDIWLTSTVTPGPQMHTVFQQAGRLTFTQKIGSAPAVDFLYVVK